MSEVVIVANAEVAGHYASDCIIDLVKAKPDSVLGLATGSTPQPVYRELSRRQHDVDFSRMRAFALDEYIGLPTDHPESYRAVLNREVVQPLGLNPGSVKVPNGRASDSSHAGADYEREIHAAGGIDLQILGIGTDGHIGFNEPSSSFASLTRVKTLTPQTRADNARFFDSADDVPMHCVTQGIGTILRARHLILLAFGSAKAEALAAAVEGPLTASMPASAIQMHPHVTVFVDEEAAASLANADYYRWVFDNRPEWQTF
ncbi:glucosamine-6-phosphate deaminase [Subtercola sp. PAMC28395]|uniref:glucosamine-6-phosphate deaminase n=1 Tax=Subtercola sp. PAMC28395 TaxID=2846775 RepID=UPI001C0C841B|nr:glucosamine-6-phosphate deaminase [Subtercola sp. PAMC28395]QWT24723.1 glucosamine-6-phosphate deaminase [Subtercola sp. PAMC28395]